MSFGIRKIPSKLFLINKRNQPVLLDRWLSTIINFQKESLIEKSSQRYLLTVCKSSSGINNNINNNNKWVQSYSTCEVVKSPPINQNETEEKCEKKRHPNEENLQVVYNTLKTDLPLLFVKGMNYNIYDQDIEFINNYKGTVFRGLSNYIKQVLLLRITGHLIYAYVKYDILKITMHPEDNTIKVRWRIRGLSAYKVFFTFWRFKIFNMQDSLQRMESWHDGFSTYYIGPNGKVYRHVADKLMPDDETVPAKDKTNIAAKLAA